MKKAKERFVQPQEQSLEQMLEHCSRRIDELESGGGWNVIPDTMQRYYDERAELIAKLEGGRR